jgi:exodeoxyribonuclease V alpha subunit
MAPHHVPSDEHTPEPTSDSGRLAGTIERITFHNPDNGFAVLRIAVPRRKTLATMVGHIAEVRVGEHIEAEGSWVLDSEYGQQFRAQSIRTSHPATAEGIRKYLGSGVVKGIGPHLAGKLVDTFGTSVFDVIEKEPQRLRQVPGIGRTRGDLIATSWQSQRSVHDIMVFLQGHGLGPARAVRVHKTYGDEAIGIIKRNPYRLAQDIDGIGFRLADDMAGRLGLPKDSPLRARAGVGFVLQELTADGHCACPEAELVERARMLLEIDEPIVQAAIDHQVQDGFLVREAVGEAPWVYLAKLYAAEVEVSRRVARLLRGRHPLPPVDFDKALPWVERQIGFELASLQRTALAGAVTRKVVVITGGPGVGKTTLVDSILRIFHAKKLSCVLAAPTGRAAKRLSEATGWTASTLHRLLEFDPREHVFRRNAGRPLEGDLFLVDEVSMMDLPLACALLDALPVQAALVLVGDVDQLPSVGPGTVLRDLIDSQVVPTVRLTEVFRQAARSRIVVAAHEVNRGLVPDLEASPDGAEQDFYFVRADEPDEAVQRLIKVVTQRIPERFGLDAMRDVQVLAPMHRGVLGVQNLNRTLQEALNPARGRPAVERGGARYAVGDKVLQTRNDYDKDVFNGDLGVIAAIDLQESQMAIDFDGRRITYALDELDAVLPAFAMTIHKSQGSEFPAVVIPLHTQHYIMLQRNLLYTALTRARRLVVLIGSPRAVTIAAQTASASERYTALRQRLEQAVKGARTEI